MIKAKPLPIFFCFIASPVFASDITPVSPPPLETMVITANRDDSAMRDQSSNISLIDRDSLKMTSPTHINEIMQRSPGVWITRANGQEHLTAIRSAVFTGPGSCGSFFMAEDGIPLRATGFCNMNQLLHANWEQADRIEMIRGPGSALYGSNALHGIINVISEAPSTERETRLSLEGGPHDYYRGKFSYSNTVGQQGYRLSLNGVSDGGYKDDSGFDQQKLGFRHNYRTDNMDITTNLRAINLNQETASYLEGAEAYKDDAIDNKSNDNPEAYRDVRSLHLNSRFAWQIDEQSRFIVTPYLRDTDMEFLMHFLPWQPVEENGHQSVGLQSALYHDTGNDYRWISGFDLEYTDGYLKETQYDPFSPTRPEGAHYNYDVNAVVAASFAQGHWKTGNRTEVTAGIRFEHTSYDYENQLSDGSACDISVAAADCRISRPADTTESFSEWSPNIGAIYHVSDQQSLFANLTQGYRAPQTTELFRLQQGDINTDHDPVEINSVELGTRHQANDLFYELTLYNMKKKNDIFQVSSDRHFADIGKTSHKGVELALHYQLPKSMDISGNVSFARHQYENNIELYGSDLPLKGKDIDTAPRHMGSAQLGWNYQQDSRAELEWVHMGKHYTDADNLHSYEGHELINLRIRQKISSQWSATLRLTNLTDRDYAERADYSSFGGDRYFVGEPRSVYLSIEGTL